MKKITPAELRNWIEEHKSFSMIDVRELYEREAYNIGGVHMPLGEIISRRQLIETDKPVVLYCEKGIRSAIAIQRLEALGFTNLINLEGGMYGWKK